jgi:hypothetical protein
VKVSDIQTKKVQKMIREFNQDLCKANLKENTIPYHEVVFPDPINDSDNC